MNLFLFLQQMSMYVLCEGDLTEKNGNLKMVTSKLTGLIQVKIDLSLMLF